MNKTELIAAVAEKAGLSKKDSDAAVNAVLCAITDALKAGDKVQLVGFGSFETKKRAARTGQNPRTGAAVEIPASTVPTFKAGKALKDAVAKKVSRLIKRRTVANEACDAERVTVNGRVQRASYDVKVGDVISIRFGAKTLTVEVLSVTENVGKDAAAAMYREV